MAARIFIADDHEFVRKRVRGLLENNAHDWKICGEAENGQEAVSKAHELKPDLIILDLAMPTMDGLQAAREIVKLLPAVPIVMHTLHNSPEIQEEAKKAGVREVVSKMEGGRSLVSAVEALLHEGGPAPTRNDCYPPHDRFHRRPKGANS